MSDTPDDASGPAMPDMASLLEQAMDMQRQMLDAQQRLAVTEVTGESGGGLVRIVMTGDFDVRSVSIDASVVDPDDTDLLGDLVAAAFRHAVAEAVALQSAGIALPDVGGMLEGLGGIDLGGLGALGAGDGEPDER